VAPNTPYLVIVTNNHGSIARRRYRSDAGGAITIELGPAAGSPVHVDVTRG
jgi:hypothetical protein